MTGDIGALSRITPELVAIAATLIREGTVHDLGLPLDEQVPQGSPGAFTPFSFTWRVTPEGSAPHDHYQYAAETITGALHVGTHIDGLVHVAAAGRVYGNRRAGDVRTDKGFSVNGIETVPPIVTRGVLVDVARSRGVAALPDGYEVTKADLVAALGGLVIEPGDAILVRTGKIREYGRDNAAYQAGQPGVGPEGAIWLYEQGMAVLGTDTAGTEPLPFPDEHHTTHQEMLVERGVHLIENLNLDDAAQAGVAVGLFVCLPLRITGATGSWVRPVLIT